MLHLAIVAFGAAVTIGLSIVILIVILFRKLPGKFPPFDVPFAERFHPVIPERLAEVCAVSFFDTFRGALFVAAFLGALFGRHRDGTEQRIL